MSGGDFSARIDELIRQVGAGELGAEVVVDQVYAKYQELREDLTLHGGGEHHYLRNSLMVPLDAHMQTLADGLLDDVKGAMADVADAIGDQVAVRAPFEYGNLRGSAHATATDNGAVYHDRPPVVARLSEEQLRAQRRNPETGGPE